MCGIGGIMMYPMQRTEEQLEYIRELATELAIENQVRGKDSTGLAVFNKKGNYDVLKHNVKATDFTELEVYKTFIDTKITNETTNILIHTRAATQGSPENNDNNHPIVSASAVGIHNGMIYNDDDLFTNYSLPRLARVDSEAIFRLVDKANDDSIEGIRYVAEKVSGVFAVAYVKKNDPYTLHYFRNNNPTTFIYIPELNIIVFASLQSFLESAVSTCNMTCNYLYKYMIDVKTVEVMQPAQDVMLQFNVLEDSPFQQLKQEQIKFDENNDWYYGYGYSRGSWNYKDSYYYDDKVTKKEPVQDLYGYLNDIEDRFSDKEFATLIQLLDENEKSEWTKGYKAGRSSLDNEIKMREEISYKKGYGEGVEDMMDEEELAN
jgi:predicted glutamine amidotransferase